MNANDLFIWRTSNTLNWGITAEWQDDTICVNCIFENITHAEGVEIISLGYKSCEEIDHKAKVKMFKVAGSARKGQHTHTLNGLIG